MGFLCLIFIFLHQLLSFRVKSYTPIENFAINCGSIGSIIVYGQNWTGDIKSIFSPVQATKNQPSVTANATTQPWPSTTDQVVPYGTARLSHSEFRYSFPVTDGQKFVRFHFYPASYPNFDRSESLFSVKAGPYSLLQDFNASQIIDSDPNNTAIIIFREYCINIKPGERRLEIIFTPNPSKPNAYAFINAIEVVSMPSNLYFSEPDYPGFEDVNNNSLYRVESDSALQTVYRINVGGREILPEGDTGMFRFWDGDNRYLEEDRMTTEPVVFTFKPNFKSQDVANYTAPEAVYQTGRRYRMNATSNYNVTWMFKVEPWFMYMVRLHFCEIEPQVRQGDRVFQIFIADKLAEPHADVFEWTQGSLVPYKKDYAVYIFSGGSFSTVNLSIKLRPYPDRRFSLYNDIILNGIEIFKVSNDRDSLWAPNPNPSNDRDSLWAPNPNPLPSPTASKRMIIYIVSGTISGMILLLLIGSLIFRRRILKLKVKDKTTIKSFFPSDMCRYFSIAEIRAATSKFDENSIIGVGGFGNVYKGHIDKGAIPVAIKRLNAGSQQGLHEFKTEIEMLSQLSHRHLVSLLGYCNDDNEMILVYEFMARGTLRDHLYDSNNPPLSWNQRLKICLGAAKGLQYLHGGAKHNIIHRDVKTTNILLDEKWVAKVSDFGLSKIGPSGLSKSYVTTVVKGSIGYLDPEYYMDQRLTEKSDVYSFGVVLLEVLCGRPPLLRAVEKPQISLVEWARKCYNEGVINEMIDPFLKGNISQQCLNEFVEMALSCILHDGNLRPSMSDVVGKLEFVLELQEGIEDASFGGTQNEGTSEQRVANFNIDDETEEDCSPLKLDLQEER